MMAGIFGRLFGRSAPEVKESAAGRIMVMTPGQPAWSDRSYKAFAEEAYRRNVIAFRSIQAIADAVSSVPWTVWRGKTELSAHPLLDLIEKPNPRDSRSQYLHAKVGFLLLSGNSYEEHVQQGGQVREMYQLRPDRMKVVPGGNGFPQAYIYEVGQRKVRFDIDPATMRGPVRHLKLFHPTDDWYGLSPIEAGAYAVDTHNEAGAWIQSLLQKSARPSGALSFKDDKPLADDEFNRLKVEIDEQYGGSRNAGRPMLLEGGLQWQQMGLSPVDMALIETKLSSARDVALALGVPPQLLGIPGDNTYCLPFDSRVSTPNGPAKIGEVREGDIVYSQDGNKLVTRKVTWHGKVGTKQTYRVKLTNRDIVATGNHPVLVRRDTGAGECRLVYVPVENLQPGDIAVIAHALPQSFLEKDPMGGDLDPHKMELYGFYTGDGSSALPVAKSEGKGYRRGGFVSLAIPEGASYLDHYATVLAKEAGGASIVSAERCITAASSELAKRLRDLGLTGTAHTKRVPSWVFKTSKTMKLAYLRGILDSDGSVDKNGRMTIALCSLDLLTDIWHLAMDCGLRVGRIWSRETKVTLPQGTPFLSLMHGFMISEPESVLEIGTRTPEYFERICENCGKSKFKRHWYSTGGASHGVAIRQAVDTEYMSYSRVLDILPEGEADVYDIEVEGTHNFIADGVFVHNSNYQEARLAFWEDTVMPLVGLIADDWNASIGEDAGVTLKPDFDQVPAIVEKKRQQWAMLDSTSSLTLNEKREAMGYEPVDGGDEIMVGMSSIPLGMARGGLGNPDGLTADDVKALAYGMDAKVLPLKGVK